MTHDDLVKIAETHLRGTRRCSVVILDRGGYEIPDAIGWGKHSILIECKTSLSDFYSDQKKPGRKEPRSFSGMGRERWYLTPKGLINPGRHTLPPRWGLMETNGRRIKKIVHADIQPEYNRDAEIRMMMSELQDWNSFSQLIEMPSRTWGDKYEIANAVNKHKRRHLDTAS
ncbi:MAG: hypothetical protein ACE5FA_00420 [Dehalococcoidia bacterium]